MFKISHVSASLSVSACDCVCVCVCVCVCIGVKSIGEYYSSHCYVNEMVSNGPIRLKLTIGSR